MEDIIERLERLENEVREERSARNALELALWLVLNTTPNDAAQRWDKLRDMQESLMRMGEPELVLRQVARVEDVIFRLQPDFRIRHPDG